MSRKTDREWRRHLETGTKPSAPSERTAGTAVVPVLTILCHGDPARVGEWAWLPELAEGRSAAVSRLEPLFEPPVGGEPRPLAEPRVSRSPFRLIPHPEGVRIDPGDCPSRVEVDGEILSAARTASAAELDRGIVLLLADRVALVLRHAAPAIRRPPYYGLVGESPEMSRLRREIDAVADLDVPVLLRGESGTGKELVAQALQAAGPRRNRPFVRVNMGAVPPTLAAAELFGSTRGAYSGAERRRRGFFREADGGTLFLDEIGESPPEVQVLLLRALESGEIQPVGSEKTDRVDVRVIAATDADLDEAVRQGSLRAQLLHRLRSYEIFTPPLRRHPEDLGRLFFHLLRQELERIGEADRLTNRGPYDQPFAPARLLADMAADPWAGNVRELRNRVRGLVVSNRGADTLQAGPRTVEPDRPPGPPPVVDGSRELRPDQASDRVPNGGSPWPVAALPAVGADSPDGAGTVPSRSIAPNRFRDPSDVTEGELVETLQAHRWNLKATAADLGVSRTALYRLISRCPDLRKAADVPRDEIERASARVGPGLDRVAAALNVSTQGLKRRLHQLGLSPERLATVAPPANVKRRNR